MRPQWRVFSEIWLKGYLLYSMLRKDERKGVAFFVQTHAAQQAVLCHHYVSKTMTGTLAETLAENK